MIASSRHGVDPDAPVDPPAPGGAVRFGVLGAARIAPKALIRPIAAIDGAVVTVVAARDRFRAEAFAAEHGIPTVVDDYAAVVTSDQVDVVYNPLPMSLHAHWTIAAMEAGKHVLCEKPFAANAAEAAAMVAAASRTGRVLGEAFHHRYHPLFPRVLDEVRSGRIGPLRRVEAWFSTPVARPDLRWDYATAGGSLMDLGCYPMSWVRHVTGEEPAVVSAAAVEGPPRIDASMETELVFPSGVTARVRSAMDEPRAAGMRIIGRDGGIDVDNPMAPQSGNRLTITTPGGTTTGPVDAGVSYDHMVRAFLDHLVHGAPFPTSGADAVANMAAIDAVYEASGLGRRGDP
ncbi:MAG: Gfo/Idh/MocA family protein [Acidimicrobiales bacterium]